MLIRCIITHLSHTIRLVCHPTFLLPCISIQEVQATITSTFAQAATCSLPIGPGADNVDPIVPPDPPVDCLAGLENFPGISQSAPSVQKFACMVDKTLKPWLGIPGATRGMGRRGMIPPETFHIMSKMPQVRRLRGRLFSWQLPLPYPRIQPPSYAGLAFKVATPNSLFPLLPDDLLRRLSMRWRCFLMAWWLEPDIVLRCLRMQTPIPLSLDSVQWILVGTF